MDGASRGDPEGIQSSPENPFSYKSFLQTSKQSPCDTYEVQTNRVKMRKTLVIVDEDSSDSNGSQIEPLCLDSTDNYISDAASLIPVLDIQLPTLPEVSERVDEIDTLVSEAPLDNLPDFSSTEFHEVKQTQWHNKMCKEIELLNIALIKSREENLKLGEKLHSKCTRIEELEQKVKQLKHKEAEDFTSLEQMVQQVEQNLKITTERALSAESTVTKLYQEIKILQDEVNILQKEKLQHNENVSLAAEQVSKKINVTADNAEHSLKALLEGVEQLKVLSSVAANIGRIQEDAS